MRTILPAAFVAAPLAAMLMACAPGTPSAEPLRSVQAKPERVYASRVDAEVPERRVEVGQAVCEGDTPVVLDDVDSALGGRCQLFESIARKENPK